MCAVETRGARSLNVAALSAAAEKKKRKKSVLHLGFPPGASSGTR